MTRKEWQRRNLPSTIIDPLTMRPSKVTFIDVVCVPDDICARDSVPPPPAMPKDAA